MPVRYFEMIISRVAKFQTIDRKWLVIGKLRRPAIVGPAFIIDRVSEKEINISEEKGFVHSSFAVGGGGGQRRPTPYILIREKL